MGLKMRSWLTVQNRGSMRTRQVTDDDAEVRKDVTQRKLVRSRMDLM